MTEPLVLVGTDRGFRSSAKRDYSFAYQDYVDALQVEGIAAALVPCQSPEGLESLLQRSQGLLIPGGDDLIFSDPLPEETFVDPKRQQMDLYLVEQALKNDLPILGVCYGMQLLQFVYGGQIIRHLSQSSDHQAGVSHKLVPTGEGVEWFGQQSWDQASYHHQGIQEPAPELETLVLSGDGLVEGFWDPQKSFVAGFQWHVEKRQTLADQKVFFKFAQAVKQLSFSI